MTTQQILKTAKQTLPQTATLTTAQKDAALCAMADALIAQTDAILEANAADIKAARGSISEVMLDRLALSKERITAMADGIRAVAALPDPTGAVLETTTRADGLVIQKQAVSIGVIGIIYESRPNVTADAAALAVKSGNVCVLRGGKEAFHSANAIVTALQQGLATCGLPATMVQLIQDTTRASANEMMKANGYIDMLIPRGGAGLIRACVENATVPCIQTGTGICHIYVQKTADIQMALDIVENAKTSRPSVCNAAEVCLVDAEIASQFLPLLQKRLVDDRQADGKTPVALRLDTQALQIIDGTPAGETDFDTEFLDYVLAIKVVKNTEEAVAHIREHSTGHSEAIVSCDDVAVSMFTAQVDSAAVYVNASTRFTDGGEFGLGCEMGISTQKLHARGPMGLKELTTYKYVILGNGHIR
ncbi:MAG: glutamate-5-semialdehyde dehydrogenase [Clostridia bacterium]|nr:glutamate-5-semialdehyde dehydrogenase [Clostridia bacterium]